MPIIKSAKKALRQSKRKTVFNRRVKDKVKSTIRAFKKSPSEKKLTEVYSVLDKATKKKVFHKNKTARLKARMAKKVSPPTPKKKVSEKVKPGNKKMAKK